MDAGTHICLDGSLKPENAAAERAERARASFQVHHHAGDCCRVHMDMLPVGWVEVLVAVSPGHGARCSLCFFMVLRGGVMYLDGIEQYLKKRRSLWP